MTGTHFDVHCHLQDRRFGAGLAQVLERAEKAGVDHMVCCGTREEDWDLVLDLARAHPQVIPMAGLHPWHVGEAAEGWLERLEARFDAGAGAGECGLDFSEGRPPRAPQEAAFRAQVLLAIRRDLPLSIHCVGAWGALVELLGETGLPAAGGLVHAYSGSPEMALVLQGLGLHLSFSCTIIRAGATRAAASLAAVGEDRFLFETDAPDLAPAGVPLNEPANVALVAQAASRIRGRSAAAPAYDNARRFFRRWMT